MAHHFVFLNFKNNKKNVDIPFNILTCKLLTTGTGVTGDFTGPMPSKNVYSALSVLIIVQEAPSFIISLLGSFGQGVACYEKKTK